MKEITEVINAEIIRIGEFSDSTAEAVVLEKEYEAKEIEEYIKHILHADNVTVQGIKYFVRDEEESETSTDNES